MAQAGIFSEGDRVELIEGEVVNMSPIGSIHAGCVNRLTALLSEKLGKRVVVGVQNPIRIDEHSEPEPDIALLKPRRDYYADAHPTPRDALLIIEVADSSLEYDRTVKLLLYARAGIPESWIVNLLDDAIETHSEPRDGKYQASRVFHRGETIVAQTVANLALNVDEILG